MQESTEPRRPSGFARWGWAYSLIAVAGGLPNIVLLVMTPTWLRFGVACFTVVSVAACLFIWWRGVIFDRTHRARMAELDQRIARLRGIR